MRTPTKVLLVATTLIVLAVLIRVFTMPFDELFTHTGPAAQLLFVLLIITEVIIAPIPGGVISLLGAAHFGFLRGWMLLYIGNVLGANAAFLLARHLGRPFVKRAVPKKHRKPYEKLMHKYPKLFWLAYAIPILPIDILSILLGLTAVKHRTFFVITATGLITYTGLWAYLGAHYLIYVPHLELISTLALLFILGIIVWWAYKEFGHHIRWDNVLRKN